jgi:predicted amidophosphoribosyltransferase
MRHKHLAQFLRALRLHKVSKVPDLRVEFISRVQFLRFKFLNVVQLFNILLVLLFAQFLFLLFLLVIIIILLLLQEHRGKHVLGGSTLFFQAAELLLQLSARLFLRVVVFVLLVFVILVPLANAVDVKQFLLETRQRHFGLVALLHVPMTAVLVDDLVEVGQALSCAKAALKVAEVWLKINENVSG